MLAFQLKRIWRAPQFIKQQQKAVEKWNHNGKPLPPPKEVKQEVVRTTAKKYGIKILIETGTFKGQMVYAQFPFFKRIVSIELSEELYKRAAALFKSYPNVKLIRGDSAKELKNVMSDINGAAVIWLDAHYSGGNTAKGDIDTPINKELKIISETSCNHAILIDDAKDFIGINGYPTKEHLEKMCSAYFPNHSFSEEDNIFRVLPR